MGQEKENARFARLMPCAVSILRPDARWKPAWKGADAQITDAVSRTLQYIGLAHKPLSLTVVLADDEQLRALNRDFRRQDKPTNVLSFPGYDDALEDALAVSREDALFLGDIVCAFETLQKEAAAQGKSFVQHALHMIVHGTLHLAGFDHHAEDEAESMESYEIQILKLLGFANPYMI